MSEKYTIGELAKQLNVTTRTIRYYDQKGLLKPSGVNENGYRLYSGKQIKQLKLIIFLKELGFSLRNIQKVLEDPNSEKTISLLLEDQLEENIHEIRKLEKRNKQISLLQKVLKKTHKMDQVTDITKIMNNGIRYKELTRSMWHQSAVMMIVELMGMLICVYFFINKMNFFAYSSVTILIIVLLVLSTILLKKYYQKVAYICPNCDYKFVPELKNFMFAAHTPHTRKLRCPNCHEKSYCLEVVR